MSAAQSAFVSYSREDSEFALRLTQDLKAAGAHVWLDQLDISPGRPWDNAIEEALNDAPQMLLILSPSSAKSDNVRNEISYALEQGKIIIPVLYQNCTVPLRLQRTQRIDFRADYAHGLTVLLMHLQVVKPDLEILKKAADDEEKRQAAWQAREAEAQRLRETPERQQEEAERKARDEEQLRLKAAREQTERERLEHERLQREADAAALREKQGKTQQGATDRSSRPIRWAVFGGAAVAALLVAAVYVARPKPPQTPAVITNIPAATASVAPANAALANQQGDADYARKDYDDAVPLYQQACDFGEPKGCTSLGLLYSQGDGVTKNPEMAVYYYQKACSADQAVGCRDLGNHQRDGDGAPQNIPQAVISFQKSCDGGDGIGCRNLAILYDAGTLVAKDLSRAKQLYQKGCALNDQPSCDAVKDARFS